MYASHHLDCAHKQFHTHISIHWNNSTHLIPFQTSTTNTLVLFGSVRYHANTTQGADITRSTTTRPHSSSSPLAHLSVPCPGFSSAGRAPRTELPTNPRKPLVASSCEKVATGPGVRERERRRNRRHNK